MFCGPTKDSSTAGSGEILTSSTSNLHLLSKLSDLMWPHENGACAALLHPSPIQGQAYPVHSVAVIILVEPREVLHLATGERPPFARHLP